jgi:hypothetical protein
MRNMQDIKQECDGRRHSFQLRDDPEPVIESLQRIV